MSAGKSAEYQSCPTHGFFVDQVTPNGARVTSCAAKGCTWMVVRGAAERDVFADEHEYTVHVEWRPTPEPLFRLSGMGTSEQWVDNDETTAQSLRVVAREFVARRIPVDLVDCPTDVKVFYDQAAVERLLFKASVDKPVTPSEVSDVPEGSTWRVGGIAVTSVAGNVYVDVERSLVTDARALMRAVASAEADAERTRQDKS